MYMPRRRPLAVRFGHAAALRARAAPAGARPATQVTQRIMDDIAGAAAMSDARPRRWPARGCGAADPTAARFTGSLAFDRRLWPHDIVGSVAWARALARAGLLTDAERDADRGRPGRRSAAELAGGTFPFRPELEDIHMNVERRLLELVGEVGGKLHTGRSRNDQIALDERLYLKDVAARTGEVLRAVQQALVARAAETVDTPMPGYTHMQRAQPIVLAHHLLAYVFMLQRDRERFAAARRPRRRAAARRRRARRRGLPDRSRGAGPRSRLRRRHAQQPRRGQRSRLRARVPGRRRHHRHAPLAAGRRPGAVGHRGVRLRRVLRRLRHRLVDHAAEEEPRRGRADPRQERAPLRQPHGGAHR